MNGSVDRDGKLMKNKKEALTLSMTFFAESFLLFFLLNAYLGVRGDNTDCGEWGILKPFEHALIYYCHTPHFRAHHLRKKKKRQWMMEKT